MELILNSGEEGIETAVMLKQSSVNAAFRGQFAKPFLTSWRGWRQRTRHIMSGPAAKGSIEVLDDWDRIQRP